MPYAWPMAIPAVERTRAYRARKRQEAANVAGTRDFPNIATAPPSPPPLPLVPREAWVDALAKWSHDKLTVPYGLLADKPYDMPAWQLDFLRDAFKPGVFEAVLCTPRKNGKTGLLAALLLAFLVGPLVRRNWRVICVSLTGLLAKELLNQMKDTAKASNLTDFVAMATPPPGRALGLLDTSVDCLAADKATGHAIGADLVVVDEAGLMGENMRGLWSALRSCVAARGGMVMSISIRGDSPMFEELRDRRGEDGVVWHEYAAGHAARLLDPEVWSYANPGLGSIKSVQYMRARAQEANSVPAAEPGFRAYDLNQRVDPDVRPPLTPAQLEGLMTQEQGERKGPCMIGLDLGGPRSMTAVAVYWPETYRSELYCAFPSTPDLKERGRLDRVGGLYVSMANRGELRTFGRRVCDVGAFLRATLRKLPLENVVGVWADRFRKEEVADVLEELDPPLPFELRGQGAVEGSADYRWLFGAVMAERVTSFPHVGLLSACRNAALVADRRGNEWIERAKHDSRIDVLQAWMLAVAAGERLRDTGLDRELDVMVV